MKSDATHAGGETAPSAPTTTPSRERLALRRLLFATVGVGLLWWTFGGESRVQMLPRLYSVRPAASRAAASLIAIVAMYLVLGGGRLRHRVFAMTALAGASLLVLGVIETTVALRWIDFRGVFGISHGLPWKHPKNRFDRELITLHRPGRAFAGALPGALVGQLGISTMRTYSVEVAYDDRGFRNPPGRATADVALIGDSFVEGVLVNDDALVSTRLESMLGVPVLNLGHIAYGPQQELVVLRRFALPARPRVVVWALFEGNDVVPGFARYERYRRDPQAYLKAYDDFVDRSFSRNALFALTRLLARDGPTTEKARAWSAVLLTPGEGNGERTFFESPSRPLNPDEEGSMTGTLEVLREAVETCSANNIRFLLALCPTKYRVYRDRCAPDANSPVRDWTPSDIPHRLETWTKARRVEYLDLTEALSSAAAAGGLVYFLDDPHWTPAGHDAAAAAIADRLIRLGWIEPRPEAPMAGGEGRRSPGGDVAHASDGDGAGNAEDP